MLKFALNYKKAFSPVQNHKGVVVFLALLITCAAMVPSSGAEEYKYPYSPYKERDPLRPLVSEQGEVLIREKKELGDFLLQGIIYSPGGSTAIMNNEVYKEGDIFDGYTIKKIDSAVVMLEKDGKEFILKWEG